MPSFPRTHHAPLRHLFAPASLGNIVSSPRPRRTSQQAPTLPISFKHSLAMRTIIKMHRRPRYKRIPWNHIPQIFSDHICRQKIKIIQRIQFPAARRPRAAPRPSMAGRALHLHLQQPPPALHRKVIRTAISPGLQYRKPQHRSLRQKRRLHRLPQPLRQNHPQPLHVIHVLLWIIIFRHKKRRSRVSALLRHISFEKTKGADREGLRRCFDSIILLYHFA